MAGVEPATSSLPRMRSTTELHQQHELQFATTRIYECINKKWAENGAQTRDPQLGRLVLYRLSYFRELTTTSATVILCGSRWIRTTEGENQQIYSLPHLAALEYSQYLFQCSSFWSLLSDSNQRPRDYKSRALANWAKEAGHFSAILPRLLTRRRKSGAKVVLFFQLTKYFSKKMHFYLLFS